MKKIFFLSVTLMSVFLSCDNSTRQDAKQNNAEGDSVITDKQSNALPAEQLVIMNQTGFSKYAKASSPQVDWSKFTNTKFWNENFRVKTAFTPAKNYLDSYGQFLKYSPDSSKFIDLDSYNISIKKNKNGQLVGEAQGPDTEVSLIDLKSKESTQLLFLGPGNSVEDAAWIDNDNLILLGYLENDQDSGVNAAIWQFNLITKDVELYELSDEVVVRILRNYSEKVRLRNVKIR